MGLNELIKIGTIIKKYRKQSKLTQAQMAVKIKIPRSTYANYENNTREPTSDTLMEIADVLGQNVFSLIKEAQILSPNLGNKIELKRHLPFNEDLMRMIIQDMANNDEITGFDLDEDDYTSLIQTVKSTIKKSVSILSLKNSDLSKH